MSYFPCPVNVAFLAQQCIASTGETGSFLFQAHNNEGIKIPISPVLPTVELFVWCKANGWEVTPGTLASEWHKQ